MKVIMYGAEICPDCVEVKAKLAASATIELDFRDITKSTTTLREFLSYRDQDKMFASVIKTGRIGIPFFILENSSKTFNVDDFLGAETSAQAGSFCSINGKGC